MTAKLLAYFVVAVVFLDVVNATEDVYFEEIALSYSYTTATNAPTSAEAIMYASDSSSTNGEGAAETDTGLDVRFVNP